MAQKRVCSLRLHYGKKKKENYNLIAIDLHKHQALDGDPKPVQQVNFT